MTPKKGTFSTQLAVSLLLFVFCTVLSFAPDTAFVKPKAAIRAILTTHTDLGTTMQKISSYFIKDKSEEALAPVTNMTAPTSGTVLKGFGMQDASENKFHYGVVLSCPDGEAICAANHGTVSEIATTEEYGSYIIITHSEEISTLYGGLNEIFTAVGDKVQAGHAIAKPENGKSFTFELRRGDTYLDPAEYISVPENAHD